MSDLAEPRPLHLVWNGVEWVDDRCGCRYHPDDQNMSHGGAPHVHRCERHSKGAKRIAQQPDTGECEPDSLYSCTCDRGTLNCPISHEGGDVT